MLLFESCSWSIIIWCNIINYNISIHSKYFHPRQWYLFCLHIYTVLFQQCTCIIWLIFFDFFWFFLIFVIYLYQTLNIYFSLHRQTENVHKIFTVELCTRTWRINSKKKFIKYYLEHVLNCLTFCLKCLSNNITLWDILFYLSRPVVTVL